MHGVGAFLLKQTIGLQQTGEPMTIAILSDTHLGDPATRLQHHGGVAQSAAFADLRRAILKATGGAPLDMLVLNGDIMDFSIGSFADSCTCARGFFDAIANEKLAARILYVPGNHDKQIWDGVEWQVNVIDRMARGELPRPFRHTQPAVVDLRGGSFGLPGVSAGYDEGTLFLQGLFSNPDDALPIMVAYPNLYVVGPDGVVTVVSHGPMVQIAWVLVSELLQGQSELKAHPGLAELEEYNYPVTAAICTAVGQAGAVTEIVSRVQHEVKAGQLDTLNGLLDRAFDAATEDMPNKPGPAVDALLRWAAPRLLRRLMHIGRGARHEVGFWHRKVTLQLMQRFDEATRAETRALGIADPARYIFGHTHDQIGTDTYETVELGDRQVRLYNTGGWLDAPGDEAAAEVFFFDDFGALTGVEIR